MGWSSPNRSVAASFDVELRHEQNYYTGDLLSHMQSTIPKLTLEQKRHLRSNIVKTVNIKVREIFLEVESVKCS